MAKSIFIFLFDFLFFYFSYQWMCEIKVTYKEAQNFSIGLGSDICISSLGNLTETLSSFPCQTLIKEQLA